MPFSRGLRREIIYICLSGVCAVMIFYFVRPLGFAYLGTLLLLGYGAVSISAAILYVIISHYLYHQFWETRKWTLGLEILHSLCFLLFIALAIMIYGNIERVTDFSFKSSLLYVLYTVVLGLIPVVVRAILVRNWRLKKDLTEAKKINALLRNRKVEEDEKVIEFKIPKKETLQLTNQTLLFIESRENYLNISWDTGKGIKTAMIRMTMKEAIQLINDPFIVFSHRSFIVNLRRVKEITLSSGASEIIFEEVERPVPMSDTFKKALRQKLREL